MTTAEKIGIQIPEVLLPGKDVDLHKWAVIACDQFTSEPEYWERVSETVGNAPSTYHMILPEAWLTSPDKAERIAFSQAKMREYLDSGLLEPHKGFVLVERTVGNAIQTGLIVALDLETYDFNKGSQSLIRATEGTILDRLPPRMQVRRGAPLELPHILVLYDDPDFSVLKPLLEQKDDLPLAYDFDLMEGSGHISGHYVEDPETLESVIDNIAGLLQPEKYQERYGDVDLDHPLLFAMGDGNHSLATAKSIWEELKPTVGMDHPARYALVELVNLHDPSLKFEPIHRVMFNVGEEFRQAMLAYYEPDILQNPAATFEDMKDAVLDDTRAGQRVGMITPEMYSVINFRDPAHNLAVGTLQEFLDLYLLDHPEADIDYVHGDDVLMRLSQEPRNVGFYLPPIPKDNFFKSIILDGSLPRKTFSMGHAEDKRFYLEARRIM
ncbi:MAG: DUF1015 domain-containing protein [Anaerolineaceae bacterium]|jgi:hypothetical protein|nr:DUF1015 domain-containing protein [Anaerolineaceae bacterium]MDD4042136.1 DUF1015 domain-containing protein [Anaerolineaceae bacterium]MDD4579012.1 DUF1015 domain-containing protein [Anaerolineaceae bacterium]